MCRHYAVFKSKYVPQQGGAVLRGLPLKKIIICTAFCLHKSEAKLIKGRAEGPPINRQA